MFPRLEPLMGPGEYGFHLLGINASMLSSMDLSKGCVGMADRVPRWSRVALLSSQQAPRGVTSCLMQVKCQKVLLL